MAYASNGNVRLYYETVGDPALPPLLLVRGLLRSSRFWSDEFREALREHFFLIMPDNRGIGRSDAPRPPYSTATMADDLAAVLDACGVERSHVMGLSLGGMICQELALRHRNRLDRLILGCTSMGGSGVFRRPAQLWPDVRLGPGIPAAAMASFAKAARMSFADAMRATAPVTIGKRTLDARPDIIDTWVKIATEQPATENGKFGQLLAALRHDTRNRLPGLQCPTLVITGTEDLLIPAPESFAVARAIPGAAIRTLPGVGHDYPTEAPHATAELIREFLLP